MKKKKRVPAGHPPKTKASAGKTPAGVAARSLGSPQPHADPEAQPRRGTGGHARPPFVRFGYSSEDQRRSGPVCPALLCPQEKMLSTGDIRGCLRRLETLLRTVKYPGNVDYNGLSKGDPSAFLPIVSFTFTSFSPPFTEQLMEAGLELTGKTDLRFTDALYKVLRDIFHYKPVLSKQQFLQWGFAQRKISVICDVINLVLQKHNQLKKGTQHKTSTRSLREENEVRGTGPATQSTGRLCQEDEELEFEPRVRCPAFHSDGTEEAHPALTAPDDSTTSAVEERLSALETKVEGLLSGLDRLRVLEKHLEELERWRETEKNEGEVITISRTSWEHLTSRVLLLETKLELSNAQLNAPPSLATVSSSSSFTSGASKDRLQSIINMLKDTSSMLKNTDSTLQVNDEK